MACVRCVFWHVLVAGGQKSAASLPGCRWRAPELGDCFSFRLQGPAECAWRMFAVREKTGEIFAIFRALVRCGDL